MYFCPCMKSNRYISMLLSVLILVSNIGLALNVHYCMGEVSTVSLAYKAAEPVNEHHLHNHEKHSHKKACCAVADDNHKSCCDNDLVKLQDKNEGKIIVKSLQLDLGAFCAVSTEWKPAQFYTQLPAEAQQTPAFYCEANAPPFFKLYCQYILYA